MLAFVSRSVRRQVTGGTASGADDAAGDIAAAALARLARGDASALEPLYRREAAAVYRYALALCGNPAWAADATQEAFVALADRPSAYDARRGTLGAYLAGVARHLLLGLLRRAREQVPLDGGDDDGTGAADAGDPVSPETLLVQAQSSQRLWAALRSLPWVFREAVVLVDLQERPYAEAAAIAGVELNTLRTRLHRARLKLARQLGPAAGEPR